LAWLEFRHVHFLFVYVRNGGDMNRLDLIIDALDLATETSNSERINILYRQALAAARELKALKPVMILSTGTKLYALDKEQA
jgi:hypothetical protein